LDGFWKYGSEAVANFPDHLWSVKSLSQLTGYLPTFEASGFGRTTYYQREYPNALPTIVQSLSRRRSDHGWRLRWRILRNRTAFGFRWSMRTRDNTLGPSHDICIRASLRNRDNRTLSRTTDNRFSGWRTNRRSGKSWPHRDGTSSD